MELLAIEVFESLTEDEQAIVEELVRDAGVGWPDGCEVVVYSLLEQHTGIESRVVAPGSAAVRVGMHVRLAAWHAVRAESTTASDDRWADSSKAPISAAGGVEAEHP
jgi:hypothetical protein